MPNFVFDIETGPLPLGQIQHLYKPPEKLPPWSDDMVKYGVMKDPAKRAEKLEATKRDYLIKLENEAKEIEADKQKWLGEASLSPITGQILAIGIRKDDQVVIIGEGGESEKEIVSAFWMIYKKYHAASRFIGFCSNFFDFPFIVWRSYFHNIEVPDFAWDKTGRYPAYCFIDLIDRLPKRGFNDESRKLTDICRWLGIGGKPDGIDGGMFAALWNGNEESRQQAIAYLINELDMAWKLAERMGVIL